MRVAPTPFRAKAAMAAISGLILPKLILLKASIRWTDGFALVVKMRDTLLTPPVVAIALAVFAWVCWVTFRLGRENDDTRFALKVLLALDAFLSLLLMSIEHLRA